MKRLAASLMLVAGLLTVIAHAAEPLAPDEPLAKSFSSELAAQYLDSAALDWQHTHACTSCHTMFPYLMARPALAHAAPQSAEVRQFFEDVAAGKCEAMPGYECGDVEGAVAIGVAAALALNDRGTTGKLHPLTRAALDRMWKLQRADGGWPWPFRDTPPLKVDEHYGATLAAIATGMAPGEYRDTPAARTGLESVRRFLKQTPAVTLHQKAMLVWAAAHVDALITDEAKSESLSQLLAAQRPDGGWSLASLVDNTSDKSLAGERVAEAKAAPGYGAEFLSYLGPEKAYRSSLASDGYATGFAIYVARQAGIPAADVRLERGIAWLKHNQRASGRWFTPSQAWHTQHLISNAGTGYAVLALAACGAL